MESIKKLIGRHKYGYLKSLSNLTPEQEQQVEDYEKSKLPSKDKIKAQTEYFDKINEPTKPKPLVISKKLLLSAFLRAYKDNNDCEYISTKETLANLKTLILYFSKSDDFYKSENLVKNITIGNVQKECRPSLDKGLLIIGNYGNGKTSTMRVFESIFKQSPINFKGHTANEVVEFFETCNAPKDKEFFWKKMNINRMYFDDVKTERMASNYGKANLFKDIFEKRYDNKKITYITCNYKNGHPNDVNAAMAEFGELYGGRVFDRLFKMCNIIVFNGKSMRG